MRAELNWPALCCFAGCSAVPVFRCPSLCGCSTIHQSCSSALLLTTQLASSAVLSPGQAASDGAIIIIIIKKKEQDRHSKTIQKYFSFILSNSKEQYIYKDFSAILKPWPSNVLQGRQGWESGNS